MSQDESRTLPFCGTEEEIYARLEEHLLEFVATGEITRKRINGLPVAEYLEQNPDILTPEARAKILEALAK